MLKEQASANHLTLSVDEILKDYRLAYQSRQASILILRQRLFQLKSIALLMAVMVIIFPCQCGIDLRCRV